MLVEGKEKYGFSRYEVCLYGFVFDVSGHPADGVQETAPDNSQL
jgi:hypothetical protein